MITMEKTKKPKKNHLSKMPNWCDPPIDNNQVLDTAFGRYVVGQNLDEISTKSLDYLLDLEDEGRKDGNQGLFDFIVLENSIPVGLYKCKSSYEAIQSFEKDYGKYIWLPAAKPKNAQIGISRIVGMARIVKLYKIPKDIDRG